MQEPVKYADDCNCLIGFIMDHIPWPSTKTEDQITELYQKTNQIWKAEFDRDMERDHLY